LAMNYSNYCSICVLPRSRPNLQFDHDGFNCNCATKEKKRAIDWLDRERSFKSLVTDIKLQNAEYDCVIPVSGGKDSTWQVLTAIKYGLRPLCVTWRSPARTELGQKNLNNLISIGTDHIDFSIDPNVEKKFILETFRKKGSPVIPMHMAIHALPVKFAKIMQIPLILWGENSAFEYGSDDNVLKGFELTRSWFLKYGVTDGTFAEDWVSSELHYNELQPYMIPKPTLSCGQKVRAVFLGQFIEWDPVKIFNEVKVSGFQQDITPKTGLYRFADIDDRFLITIHHWMKWYKFGFTRLWDNLSLEIRAGRMTRKEAKRVIENVGEEKPIREIEDFCKFLDLEVKTFWEIVEDHRNPDVWEKVNGVWKIKNFLIENWNWCAS
jgi:N-acetyl sugar amidotransferase